MKIFYLILLFFNVKVLAENCTFTAEVTPIKYHSETKALYKEICNWYYTTFNQKPLLSLDKVFYITSWEGVDIVKDKPYLQELKGVHCCNIWTERDEIYINISHYKENTVYNQSILVHELIHFFIKSSNFDKLITSGSHRDEAMHEAFAYWGQNKFIEKHSDFNLMTYIEKYIGNYEIAESFSCDAEGFYILTYDFFVYNAIHFFNEHTKLKYNKLINNEFLRNEDCS